ncbi:hypothetical protein ACH33_12355 [Aneurinibacillus sp. XH2]|nr:hypothetical protein ACH33_12355 [Aneurinibacillus sp. XH2]
MFSPLLIFGRGPKKKRKDKNPGPHSPGFVCSVQIQTDFLPRLRSSKTQSKLFFILTLCLFPLSYRYFQHIGFFMRCQPFFWQNDVM